MPLGLISGEKTLEITKRPLIPALLFFILGIIGGRFVFPHSQWLCFSFVFLISILLILTILFPYFSYRTLLPFSILFFIGVILFQIAGIQDPRLLQLAEGHKKIVLEGTVLSPGNISEGRSKFDFMVESALMDQAFVSLKEKVTVTIYKNSVDFNPGQRIRFPASLKPFRNFNNPGRYDYETTMSLRGYSCAASISDGRTIVLMGKEQTGFIVRAMESVRGPIRKLMIDNLQTVDQAVYRALILGEMQGIDDDLRESFNITGLGHVLSVSGLHVGLVAVVSFALFRFLFSLSYSLTLRIDIRKLAALITCLCVFAYTLIAGFQVSANRSMIMAITYLFSIIVGKEKDAWSTLALAAIIVLSLDPNDLFNISFQLSFIAVIGIFWLSPYIYRLIKNKFKELERGHILSRVYIYFSTLLVIGFSAVICSLPFTTYYFHRIQLLAIPINLIVEPILGLWILPIGLLSVVLLPVSYALSCFVLKIGALGLDVMMNVIQFWSQFDWIALWAVTPDMLEVVLYYCIIFFLIFTIKKRRWAQIGLVASIIAGIWDVSNWIYDTRFDPNLRVTFLDVGQGNSAFIQFPRGKNLLLDAGGFASNTFDTGRMIVAPFLLQAKIHHVDYLVLSHPHPDHLNGMKFIADHFDPKIFLYNGQKINAPEFTGLMNTLKKNSTRILLPEDLLKGIDINGVRMELLHPMIAVKTGHLGLPKEDSETNNNSLVLKISYKGNSFLFSGDIQGQGEDAVVKEAGPTLKSSVLLVPHHGSKYSSTAPFLKAVSPGIAIISCGKENSFGFPSMEALKRLGEIESDILRIDECGAITIKVNSEGMKIEKFLKPTQPGKRIALF